MTEKRFLLKYSEYETSNGEIIQAEPYFIDTKEEYVDEVYFTIDGYPTMSDEQVVKLLNEQSEQITELKQRNQRQYNRLKELGDLMLKRDWKTLENIVEEWEKQEKLLNQEWNNCEDL